MKTLQDLRIAIYSKMDKAVCNEYGQYKIVIQNIQEYEKQDIEIMIKELQQGGYIISWQKYTLEIYWN